ncbi:Haloacid dehalogenase superfamily, subfamily IA, variant 3 with third motif having DD or ED/haloacid dehalogenase superfamily, subfamily IA, variant 1 with third motif having Dx(3-4)D or Dx(3-4)E [Beijerinckiaceae bacterium RH AL1]|nr:HAD family phosphatase [Beijerinckiaceae bacterium]VVB49142.1 Haloacid dehalogenase superfamily, subfamily IA, variant 3 with third motif having DD or ED/haloacid dehalogenase superfamily, subfamily IA, variant 1 with third motif having Dx(3-4)D or Dx(3-4)E [Beijerinckiaceae bacterium RH CH11]VVB49221.1 Haloacid dehalogenase superfamily, subfamily IA, variant 3 with third motif having DD or ED/haloacid dehalogenase superfamily, subfamily IA, variant 1 with third motif having Dx(3-4)D or Dx(3-4
MAKAFIFDVDGTLVDSVAIHAETWRKAFHDFGHEIGFEELRGQIGKGGDELMPVFLSHDEVKAKGEAINARRAEILKDGYLQKIEAFPMVRALFKRLRDNGFKLALASSAHGDQLETYKHKAEIADLIEHQTSSDDAERSKPHGDIFQAALDRLGDVADEDAIVVGDTPYDAEAAGKVGLRTIGLLCGGFPEAELRKAGCVAVYKDPADLLAHYDEVVNTFNSESAR